MIKLPISDFMQNYYQEKGITFTDSERATILWNSFLPLPKAEVLTKLILKTLHSYILVRRKTIT